MDPHAENYFNISPFTYVANNPLTNIDPDGKDIVYGGGLYGGDLYTGADAQALFSQLQSQISSNQGDPEKKEEKKKEKEAERKAAKELEQNLLSQAEMKDFTGVKGKLSYVLNGGSFDGYDYNLKGEATNLTPITGAPPIPSSSGLNIVKLTRKGTKVIGNLKGLSNVRLDHAIKS